MKPINLSQIRGARGCWAALLSLTLPAFALLAADTNNAPATAATSDTNAPASKAVAPAAGTNAPAPQAAAPASATNAPSSKETAPAPLTPEQMFEGGAK